MDWHEVIHFQCSYVLGYRFWGWKSVKIESVRWFKRLSMKLCYHHRNHLMHW